MVREAHDDTGDDQARPGPLEGIRIVTVHDDAVLDAARAFLLWRTQEDYGYGHQPQWHWDLDDARATYVENPRQALWVALAPLDDDAAPTPPGALTADADADPDGRRERVVGAVAIRAGGPKVPPHSPLFAERYPEPDAVAQLVRLMVAPEFRRRGLAGELTRRATDFTREAGYPTLYLHTNALVPGALEFWRRHAVEIHDARGTAYDTDPRFATVHFEIPLDERGSADVGGRARSAP